MKENKNLPLYKILNLKNAGIYWNFNEEEFISLNKK